MPSLRTTTLAIAVAALAFPLTASPWDLKLDVGPTLMGTMTSRAVIGASLAGFRLGVDGSHDTLYQPEEEISIGASATRSQWLEQVSRLLPELSYGLDLGPLSLSPWAGYLAEWRDAAITGTTLHDAVPEAMGGMYLEYRREYLDRITGPALGLRAALSAPALSLRMGLEYYPLLGSNQDGFERGLMPVFSATSGPGIFDLYRDDFDRSLRGVRLGGSLGADLVILESALGLGVFGSYSYTRLEGDETVSSANWTITGSDATDPVVGDPWFQDEGDNSLSVVTYAYEAGASARLYFLRRMREGLGSPPSLSASLVGWVRDSRSEDKEDLKIIKFRSSFRYVKLGLSIAL